MILPPGHHFGHIRGKISTTPEQALREFNFVQNPLAKGLLFRVYRYLDDSNKMKTGTFISNYFPATDPKTPEQQAMRNRFSTISFMALQNIQTLIRPIWDPIARQKASHGCNEFRSVQLSRTGLPPDWTQLLISKGTIFPTPKILDYQIIQIAGVFFLKIDFDTYTNFQGLPSDLVYPFYFLRDEKRLIKLYTDKIYVREEGTCKGQVPYDYPDENLIVFVYFRQSDKYSNSTSGAKP